MPIDPTLGELSQQDQSAQGLPPPQPTPYGIARAQEHQQQWGMPGIGEQLSGIASKAAEVPGIALQGIGDRVQAAMRGGADEESIRAAADLAGMLLGTGLIGAERGALGVAGGRLYLRNRPNPRTSSAYESKQMDLIDESGKIIGSVSGDRLPGDKVLHVGWTGADKGPWSGGTSEMLSFMTELQHEFPGIEKIRAARVSGARRGPAASGDPGAREIAIPKHRQISAGTPRDPPPEPGTVNPIIQEREQQWKQRNKYEKMFTARTRGSNTQQPVPEPPPPAPEPPPAPPVHGPGWTPRREEETWEAMRARHDTEWNDLMQRLFGNL